MRTTHNICTRNCYDTCSMLAHVENGSLVRVSGDPYQTFTVGTLCSKGYNYAEYVYHPDRILYPLRQTPRGSGNWSKITWEEALKAIADEILAIYKETGSFLPLAYLEGTGNSGLLARSMLYLLSSLGPITQFDSLGVGAAGQDAQILDFGGYLYKDPEEMAKADLILLWGVNPASTSIHQMRLLQKAQREGAEIILIDVFPSRTAKRVDDYLTVRPGGDGALALAILRELVYKNSIDYYFITYKSEGWEVFRDWLLNIDPAELYLTSGVSQARVSYLAEKIRNASSVAFWVGKGLQKYSNSGQNIRAIHALAAAGGLMDIVGGGVYTPYNWQHLFNEMWATMLGTKGRLLNRKLKLKALTEQTEELQPSLRMLWINQSNPLVQGPNLQILKEIFHQMRLIVTMDHFLTETAHYSDIVLPTATLFETEDIVVGSWNKWIGLNEQAISPLGEVRSELETAQALAKMLNQSEAGSCSFPMESTTKEWLKLALSCLSCQNIGIEDYEQLKNGPRKISALDSVPKPEQSKYYQFAVQRAMEQGCPEIPSLVKPGTAPMGYPYRLIGIHKEDRFNSQLGNLKWLSDGQEDGEVLLGMKLASLKGIVSGSLVTVYNQWGEVVLKAKVCHELSDEVLICSSRYDVYGKSINILVNAQETDLGRVSNKFPNTAYNDLFVNISRW